MLLLLPFNKDITMDNCSCYSRLYNFLSKLNRKKPLKRQIVPIYCEISEYTRDAMVKNMKILPNYIKENVDDYKFFIRIVENEDRSDLSSNLLYSYDHTLWPDLKGNNPKKINIHILHPITNNYYQKNSSEDLNRRSLSIVKGTAAISSITAKDFEVNEPEIRSKKKRLKHINSGIKHGKRCTASRKNRSKAKTNSEKSIIDKASFHRTLSKHKRIIAKKIRADRYLKYQHKRDLFAIEKTYSCYRCLDGKLNNSECLDKYYCYWCNVYYSCHEKCNCYICLDCESNGSECCIKYYCAACCRHYCRYGICDC